MGAPLFLHNENYQKKNVKKHTVGIEDAEDIIADLKQAMEKTGLI